MSAPHEVWISANGIAKDQVRYLRADLTCDAKWTRLATLREVREMAVGEVDKYGSNDEYISAWVMNDFRKKIDTLIAKEEEAK